ncbi:MAG: glycosyltransferase family 4 protein [Terrimicrobiaceae bacterium]|nr:glycosyltransferase family 4 protein [Terrimicrobiaceae bacterium]
MKRRAAFFRIGDFSLINEAVLDGLRREFSDLEWRAIDVERDIVGRSAALRFRATAEVALRYGGRVLRERRPPRDFFPRIPTVIAAVREWVRANIDPAQTAFVFQTQSLFDARHDAVPHFLYTDHTYLANLRYPEPRPLLPVAAEWRRMERDLYAMADCNFVSSGFAARSLREDYSVPPERVECVFSGCNVPATQPGDARRSGRIVLFAGVDWERKGGPELVAAFRAVRAATSDAELWIAGCSPALSEPGVRVLGRLASERMADLYRQADVFCLPSRMDPSASVLAEAASQGLPVVATRVGGNSERVVDGVTGFLCEPHELADRLRRLLSDAEMRKKFGAAGREMARDRFTWEAVCGRMAARMRREIEP